MRYVCSKKYKILCREDCFHVKNMKEENKVWFNTIEEGLEYGCRLCKHCGSNVNCEAYRKHKAELFEIVYDVFLNAPVYPSFIGFETSEEEEQYNIELSEYIESVKPEVAKRLKEFGFIINK